MYKRENRAGGGASTMALKPMGIVNRSPKQRVTMIPQSGFTTNKIEKDLVLATFVALSLDNIVPDKNFDFTVESWMNGWFGRVLVITDLTFQ